MQARVSREEVGPTQQKGAAKRRDDDPDDGKAGEQPEGKMFKTGEHLGERGGKLLCGTEGVGGKRADGVGE